MDQMLERINTLSPEKKQLLLKKMREKNKNSVSEMRITAISRDDFKDGFPLSYSQQRLWFLYEWEPESPSYNIPCLFHLSCKVDTSILNDTVNKIILRHEILRTKYKVVKDEPVQIIHPFVPIQMNAIDLTLTPESEQEKKLDSLIKAQSIEPFNLEEDFPIRAYLYKLDEENYYLLLNIHHIACDGWSISIITSEIQKIYSALANDEQIELSSIDIQYADYAAWQRKYIANEVLERHLTYWKSKFEGELPVLQLPTDKPRPPVKSFKGAALKRSIPLDYFEKLKTLCKEEDATLYMVTLAAFFTLLYRYTGQTDIVIGSPIANRNRSEVENIVGFFVNTLPLRVDLSEKVTFRETVKYIKKITLEAYEHQDLPLEKIIDSLNIERDLSHNPLFQTLFVMQNMSFEEINPEGFNCQFCGSINPDCSKFDITFSLCGDNIQVEYSVDLFTEDTIIRMLDHFMTIIDEASENPDECISEIKLLSEKEEQQILIDWNNTELIHPEDFNIVKCIEEQAKKNPHSTALVFEGISYTYKEMNSDANRIAHYLISKGIGPEKVVGIFLERSADFVISMLAVLKAGAAYVPLDPTYPADRIEFMLQESKTELLITNKKLSSEINLRDIDIFYIDQDLNHLSSENPEIKTSPENLMYIIFTSGSTGTPKGVCVELKNFHNYINGILKQFNINEALNYAMISTLAADLGTTNVFCALCTGGTLHVISYDRSCDPDGVAEYFREHPIDVMKMVPSHLEVLLEASHPEYIIPHKLLILAGEALTWDAVHKIRSLRPSCKIQNNYGPTETTVSALAYPITDESLDHTSNIVPIGRPIGNVKAFVLDTKFNPVPVGVPGELYIGGKGVTRGYLNNKELTNSRFIESSFIHMPGEYLYKTGDRVRFLVDGSIEFLGRMDRQIKIRGFRIELGEIESIITSNEIVKDAVVILKETDKSEKRIAAYVVFEAFNDSEDKVQRLKKGLKDKLPEYMMPNIIMELDSLPLNATGKIDTAKLPDCDFSFQSAGTSSEQPCTDTEKRIAEVWKDILQINTVGIDDNFFELGGESFKALKVVRRLGDWIGIMDFFKNPTIRTLAQYIDGGKQESSGILQKLTEGKGSPKEITSLICVPYAGGSAIIYQPLASQMPENYALYSLEIPGHDFSRKDEELLSIKEIARRCVEEIKNSVQGPIALYGHCVGGALTIELARQLEAENYPLVGIFLGGVFPVSRLPGRFFSFLSKLFPSDRVMSNKGYHELLKALGGFTDVEDTLERDFMINSLRHDARESENYFTRAYSEECWIKLKTPITSVVGERDRVTELYEERYKEWSYFSEKVSLSVIPDTGHYFIKHQPDLLSHIICDSIENSHKAEAQDSPSIESHAPANSINLGTGLQKPSKLKTLSSDLKTFFIVVLSQLLSLLGSGFTGIAIGVWVYNRTGSVSNFAAISTASMLPGILALPISGAIADRYDRRLVMLFSDLAGAVSIAVLAILMATGSLQLWHIYISLAVSAISRSFHRPAFMSALAQIIPKQYLGHANGLVQFANSTSEMIAPLLGVVLLSTIGMTNIFLFDCFSFSIAIITLFVVRFPNKLFHKREEAFFKEVLMGWKFIIKRNSLVYMIIFFLIGNILFGLATVLIQPLILSFGSTTLLGTINMLGAMGAMAGGLIMSLWGGTKRRATGMVGFIILEGFFIIVTGLRPGFLLPAIGVFGIWLTVTLGNTHWQALIQTKVGLELQGRVLATNQMIAMSTIPLGYLLAGPLADSVFTPAMNANGVLASSVGRLIGTGAGRGIGLLMICIGILVVIWSTIGFNFKPLRYMEDYLEDAIPDAIIKDKDSLQEELDSRITISAAFNNSRQETFN
ncbi:MAG: amino acid adenylation domain-containing protein [Bacillota bacterium]|nr:amino acid adenylation domain-containing protein [Bacillota bacterium]